MGRIISHISIFLVGTLSFAAAGTHMTAPEALTLLKSGNARFFSNNALHPRADVRRIQDLAEGEQKPFVTVITSSDSRVPLDTIFDQGIGDIYAVRSLGNVVNEDQAGSVEFGISTLKTPLVVVLGHTQCPMVTAVAERAPLSGNLAGIVENIIPAVERAGIRYPKFKGLELVPYAIEENVGQSISDLLRTSEIASRMVEDGELSIVGAVYQVENGGIKWLSQHPQVRMLEQRGWQAREEARLQAAAEAGVVLPRE